MEKKGDEGRKRQKSETCHQEDSKRKSMKEN